MGYQQALPNTGLQETPLSLPNFLLLYARNLLYSPRPNPRRQDRNRLQERIEGQRIPGPGPIHLNRRRADHDHAHFPESLPHPAGRLAHHNKQQKLYQTYLKTAFER